MVKSFQISVINYSSDRRLMVIVIVSGLEVCSIHLNIVKRLCSQKKNLSIKLYIDLKILSPSINIHIHICMYK